MKAITVISNEDIDRETKVQPKENNYMIIENKFTNAGKYLFYIEALLGMNRLNVISCPKLVWLLAYIYSLGLVLFTVFVLVTTASTTNLLFYFTKNILVIEYVVLVFFSYTAGNKMMKSQLKRVGTFCEILKINDIALVSASLRNAYGSLAICALCNIFEIYLVFNIHIQSIPEIISVFIIKFTHDFEIVLLISQVKNLYLRVLVIKAHVERMFGDRKKRMRKLNVFEKASLKVELNIAALHKTFALMDKGSRKFNSFMNIPVTVIILSSTISTVALLKEMVHYSQIIFATNLTYSVTYIMLCVLSRLVRTMCLVAVPCYYTSTTGTQVTAIRNTLYKALEKNTFGVGDRRKIKAFVSLTRECDFSYVICGVIELNMSFPLSYVGLCFTYVIIVVQFAKFID